MEMPKSCDLCPIMMFEDTNCVNELYCGCQIVFKAHPQGVDHRPDYCPLIKLPPHGRLIDADALKDKWTHKDLDLFSQGWGWLRDLNQAPAIIPAEPCKEKGE
jgi:hypothetical protein